MGYERKGTSGTVGGHAIETTRSSPTQAQTKTSGRWAQQSRTPTTDPTETHPHSNRARAVVEREIPPPAWNIRRDSRRTVASPRDPPSRRRPVRRHRFLWRRSHIDRGLSSNESLCRLNTKYRWHVMLFVTSGTVVRSESLALPDRLVTLIVYYIGNKIGSVVISIRVCLMREPGLTPGQGE